MVQLGASNGWVLAGARCPHILDCAWGIWEAPQAVLQWAARPSLLESGDGVGCEGSWGG